MIYTGIETNNTIKKEIKKISIDTGISINDICKKLDIMPQSYQNIFKKKHLSFKDISDILNYFGYELEISFKPKD